mmetsp:Transcript_9182/g.30363  ORF Transcript_9182/g.30363 Transcript_9182/m.30363 type:complete len:605 (-) Transcript_9182:232-2046(-)
MLRGAAAARLFAARRAHPPRAHELGAPSAVEDRVHLLVQRPRPLPASQRADHVRAADAQPRGEHFREEERPRSGARGPQPPGPRARHIRVQAEHPEALHTKAPRGGRGARQGRRSQGRRGGRGRDGPGRAARAVPRGRQGEQQGDRRLQAAGEDPGDGDEDHRVVDHQLQPRPGRGRGGAGRLVQPAPQADDGGRGAHHGAAHQRGTSMSQDLPRGRDAGDVRAPGGGVHCARRAQPARLLLPQDARALRCNAERAQGRTHPRLPPGVAGVLSALRGRAGSLPCEREAVLAPRPGQPGGHAAAAAVPAAPGRRHQAPAGSGGGAATACAHDPRSKPQELPRARRPLQLCHAPQGAVPGAPGRQVRGAEPGVPPYARADPHNSARNAQWASRPAPQGPSRGALPHAARAAEPPPAAPAPPHGPAAGRPQGQRRGAGRPRAPHPRVLGGQPQPGVSGARDGGGRARAVAGAVGAPPPLALQVRGEGAAAPGEAGGAQQEVPPGAAPAGGQRQPRARAAADPHVPAVHLFPGPSGPLHSTGEGERAPERGSHLGQRQLLPPPRAQVPPRVPRVRTQPPHHRAAAHPRAARGCGGGGEGGGGCARAQA